jgi:hypothetical protein
MNATKKAYMVKDDSHEHQCGTEGIGSVDVIICCDRVMQVYIHLEKVQTKNRTHQDNELHQSNS